MGTHRVPGRRAATASPGLIIAPLPMDTVTSIVLIILVFAILTFILADRPRRERIGGRDDPFEVVRSSGSGKNQDS